MLSDERLARIEGLVRRSLNEEAMPSKVCTPIALFSRSMLRGSQGGLAGVNARVYAVKVCSLPASTAPILTTI